MVLGEPSWKNGFVSLEIAVAKAWQWGTCHFVLKHRKLWAAAELIAEKVAASAWGAGNKQRCAIGFLIRDPLALHRARQILTGSSSVMAPHSRQAHIHTSSCVSSVSLVILPLETSLSWQTNTPDSP